jgi:hypothetical protein
VSKLSKSLKREKQIEKRKNGHQSDGHSIRLIMEIRKKKQEEIKRNRVKKQERFLEGEI